MNKLLIIAAIALLTSTLFFTQHENKFETYKRLHNKVYSPVEEQFRYQVYLKNVQYIEEINSQNLSYWLGENQFSDLTAEEFEQIYLNALDEGTDPDMTSHKNSRGAASVDHSGKLGSIKDQGQCGSCWAFSAVGALEAAYAIKQGVKVVLSEQQVNDCDKQSFGCNGGYAGLAIDYINKVGLVYDTDYPYTATDGTCKFTSGKVKGTGRDNFTQVDEVFKALEGQPLSVSVHASNWSSYKGGIFNNCINTSTNHAVVAVGFDESKNWKIRNSWGPNWGEAGHITLAPEELTEQMFDFYKKSNTNTITNQDFIIYPLYIIQESIFSKKLQFIMLNNYETPHIRETLQFRRKNHNILWIVDWLDEQIMLSSGIVKYWEILFFEQALHFGMLHLCYLFFKKQFILEFALAYILSWCVLLIITIGLMCYGDEIKRYPLNTLAFAIQRPCRMFLFLYVSEYIDISKFLLLNMMILSVFMYVKLKSDVQQYNTDNEALQKLLGNQPQSREELHQQEDQDWQEVLSQQDLLFKNVEQKDNYMQKYNKTNPDQDEEEIQDMENPMDEQVAEEQEILKQNNLQEDEDIQQQPDPQIDIQPYQEVPPSDSVLYFKHYAFNYIFGILIPIFCQVVFYLPRNQLYLMIIINVIYITFLWLHCMAYYSENRLFVLNYNVQNGFFLVTSYLDADIICPFYLVYDKIQEKQESRIDDMIQILKQTILYLLDSIRVLLTSMP
ncbi:hypothetical protein pb186bvf_005607 [Paramecium bursaria]